MPNPMHQPPGGESPPRERIWDPERFCPKCHGTGRVTIVWRCPNGPNDTKPCSACDGTGVRP